MKQILLCLPLLFPHIPLQQRPAHRPARQQRPQRGRKLRSGSHPERHDPLVKRARQRALLSILRQASFAWWPGTVPAGRVTDEPWAYWDLMPTFVEMTGVEPPEGYRTDGLSLLEFLKGGQAPERDYFYWELHEGGGAKRAARWDDWKAVMPKPMAPIEIYDLSRDIAETNNLAADRPDLLKRAKEIFAEAHEPHPVWPLDRASDLKKEASSKAWPIKRKRDKEGYVPEGAIPLSEYLED